MFPVLWSAYATTFDTAGAGAGVGAGAGAGAAAAAAAAAAALIALAVAGAIAAAAGGADRSWGVQAAASRAMLSCRVRASEVAWPMPCDTSSQ